MAACNGSDPSVPLITTTMVRPEVAGVGAAKAFAFKIPARQATARLCVVAGGQGLAAVTMRPTPTASAAARWPQEVTTGVKRSTSRDAYVVDDVELTADVAAAIAAELARAGVNMNLAPVADVNVNPRNPVIGVRSFGAQASATRLAGVLRRQLIPGSDARSVIAVPPLKEAATVDGVVALVLDGLRTGRRELRYDLQKGELTLR